MARQQNASIGKCPCSMKGCSESAQVRQTSGKGLKKRLYLWCPEHRLQSNESAGFQRYIRDNAEFERGVDVAEVPQQGAAAVSAKPAVNAEKTGKKGIFSDWGWGDDESSNDD